MNAFMMKTFVLGLVTGTAVGQSSLDKALGAIRVQIDDLAALYGGLIDSGDYDRDGDVDLLFHNANDDHSWIMVADGQGDFEPLGPFLVDTFEAIVAGQFDEDPEPEVAYREFFEYAYCFEPNTDPVVLDDFRIVYNGSFDDAYALALRAADLDGDGQDELVINSTDDAVYIVWSGTGGVEEVQLIGLGRDNVLYPPADYDGDGDLDLLAFGESSFHFWLIEGTGTDVIGPVREIQRAYPSIDRNERPVFGQLDDSPGMDMIIADTQAGVMRNEFNFVLAGYESQVIPAGEVALPLAIVSDLDGSGDPDLVVMRTGEYFGGAQVDFAPAILVNPAGESPGIIDREVGPPVRSSPYAELSILDMQLSSVWAIDVDHDGDDDLVWIRPSTIEGSAQLWAIENRSDGSGQLDIGMDSYDTNDGIVHVLPLDVDDDGSDEYILAGTSNLRILDLQDGSLGRINASLGSFMSASPDLDGDGVPEIVNGRDSQSVLRIYTKQPDGSYGGLITVDGNDRVSRGIEVADFNNDGLDDLVTQDFDSDPAVYLGGAGPALSYLTEIEPLGAAGVKPAALDFDQDGWMDIAVGSSFEVIGIELFRNQGDGTFVFSHLIPVEFADGGGEPYWIQAGDIDLDGNTDLVVTDTRLSAAVLFLDQSGNATDTSLIEVDTPVEAVIADFNHDGLPDVALAGSSNGISESSAYVITQNAPREFGQAVRLPTFSSQGIAESDVNRDGIPDLVATSDDERKLRVFIGSSSITCPADLTGDGELNFFDVSAFLVDQPDYNGDGQFNFFDVAAFLADYQAGCP